MKKDVVNLNGEKQVLPSFSSFSVTPASETCLVAVVLRDVTGRWAPAYILLL